MSARPKTVYLICHACDEEGYSVSSVWVTQEDAEAHIEAKGWTEHVGYGLTWIDEHVLRAAVVREGTPPA